MRALDCLSYMRIAVKETIDADNFNPLNAAINNRRPFLSPLGTPIAISHKHAANFIEIVLIR